MRALHVVLLLVASLSLLQPEVFAMPGSRVAREPYRRFPQKNSFSGASSQASSQSFSNGFGDSGSFSQSSANSNSYGGGDGDGDGGGINRFGYFPFS